LVITGNLGTENAIDMPASSLTNQIGGAPLLFVEDPAAAQAAKASTRASWPTTRWHADHRVIDAFWKARRTQATPGGSSPPALTTRM